MAEMKTCDFCPSAAFKMQTLDLAPYQTLEVNVNSDLVCDIDCPKKIRRISKKLANKELTNKDKKLRKIMKELIFLLGNGEIANTIPDAVAKLLLRNYPDLVEFKGDKKLVIFVPDYYLNNLKVVKYVDPFRGPELKGHSKKAAEMYPERKKEFEGHANFFSGGERSYWGEVPE